MSADDLTAFKAQLDEEYASADMLAVQGANWRADEDLPGVVLSEYGHVAARCSEDELSGAGLRAGHIARYDVRRARLDIKARRAIIEEYERDPQADDRYLAGLAFAIERLAEVHAAPWWKN